MNATDFLVTGAAGFLGRAVVERLTYSGYSLVTLGRRESRPLLRHVQFDAERNPLSMLPELLADINPRWVLHLAGAPPTAGPETAYRVNAGMLQQITATMGHRVSRIVAVGTAAEYGESLVSNRPTEETALCLPVNTYGVSKYVQTMIAQAAHRRSIPITIARTFNLVGPEMPNHVSLGRFVQELRGEAARTGTLRVGSLDKKRDFVEVEQAAKVIVEIATSETEVPLVVNVCSGTSSSLADWLNGLITASRIKTAIEPVPALKRSFDPDNVVGSNALLRACGFHIRVPDIADVCSRIWRDQQSALDEPDSVAPTVPSQRLQKGSLHTQRAAQLVRAQ